jgi:hypothetical protein
MKVRILVVLFVMMLAISFIPPAAAGTITISDVTYTPECPKQGDTIKVKAKVEASADIDWVKLFPCWEQPTYTCGLPASMTDSDSDGYWEGEYSHADWTTGNIVHINVTVKDKDGDDKTYTMEEIKIGDPNCGGTAKTPEDCKTEKECKDNGFYWWDDACHADPKGMDDYKTKADCEGAGYYWWGNKCHENAPTPPDLTTKEECTGYNYFWYDGKCNAEKKEEKPKPFLPGFEALGVVAALIGLGLITRIRKK